MADPVVTPALPTSKPWYASLTVWGAIVAATATAIQAFSTSLDTNAATHLTTNPILTGVLAILGAVIAIIGRFNASTTIK